MVIILYTMLRENVVQKCVDYICMTCLTHPYHLEIRKIDKHNLCS